ncbi:MAG: type II toxin-antitoxin system RelE/ParE family toxin [Deferrisomatales bacterium]
MRRLTWTDRALTDLEALRAYVSQEDPDAARGQVLRILKAVETLAEHPGLGRPGRVAGTRELVVPRTPYIVPYRATDGWIEILRVLDSAMRWPTRL